MAGISAVTVTWNSLDVLTGLFDSILTWAPEIDEVIAVDNASGDGTKALIRERYPDVRIIENGSNRGFAAAANQGISASRGEFVLLVNPDISFGPGFVGPLVDALMADPRAGAAAPKLVRPGGGVIDSAGLMMRKSRKAVDRGRDETDRGQYDRPGRVFGACGAAAMLRRAMLADVMEGSEYFDESFFSYKEDVDLAWRANLLGWKAVYVPDSVAEHGRGWRASGRKSVPSPVRVHSHKNRYLTILKNEDAVNFLLHLPWILSYEAALFAYALVSEPFLLRAFKDAARLYPAAMEKRRDTMSRRRLSARRMRGLFG